MKQNTPIKRNCACVYTVDMQRKASEGTINLGDLLMLMITCFFFLPQKGRNPLRKMSLFGFFPLRSGCRVRNIWLPGEMLSEKVKRDLNSHSLFHTLKGGNVKESRRGEMKDMALRKKCNYCKDYLKINHPIVREGGETKTASQGITCHY